MLVPPLDDGETVRLCSLQNLKVLDALPEERFDRITRLAARMFKVPVALVSLVESNRRWLKSEHGLAIDQSDGLNAFFDHPVLREEGFAVHDTSEDSRFANTPLAVGKQTIRFCAGQPVHSPGGVRAGTLCLIDYKPRYFSEAEVDSLKDFAEMVDHEMSLLAQTTSDELTRVANRRGFIQIATSMLTLCQRQRKPASIIGFDLNKFKMINDTFGHGEGDKVLNRFAALLVRTFRESDIVARFGGDEFCVLSSYATAEDMSAPLGRLDAAFSASSLKQEFPNLSWSAGIAQYDPPGPPDLEKLLREADAQMYAAKSSVA